MCRTTPSRRVALIWTALVMSLGLAASAEGAVVQAPGSPFSMGATPFSVAVGDFDRSGSADLAVAHGSVTVLLGDGRGGFAPAPGSPFSTGSSAFSVAAGDLDRNGRLDLAVTNLGTDDVSVLLGDGRGGFTSGPGSPFPTGGATANSVAVGDFDRSGTLDLATANGNSNDVGVLLGDGRGRFATAAGSPFASGGSNPHSVAVGNFDRGVRLDVAVANSNSGNVTVLLGDGHGGLAQAPNSPFAVVAFPNGLAAGKFDRNATLDLAVADEVVGGVAVLLNDGRGRFAAAPNSPFATGNGPFAVAVADFDRSRTADIATANLQSSDITVLLGDGRADFAPAPGSPFSVAPASGPWSVAVGDFDRDGRPDAATANLFSSDVTVLLNQR